MAISPKVSASTVGAAASTVVTSILAAHSLDGRVAPDVLGLIQAAVIAAVTFGSGYITKHVPAPIVADVEAAVKDVAAALPATQVAQLPLENPQPAAQPSGA